MEYPRCVRECRNLEILKKEKRWRGSLQRRSWARSPGDACTVRRDRAWERPRCCESHRPPPHTIAETLSGVSCILGERREQSRGQWGAKLCRPRAAAAEPRGQVWILKSRVRKLKQEERRRNASPVTLSYCSGSRGFHSTWGKAQLLYLCSKEGNAKELGTPRQLSVWVA